MTATDPDGIVHEMRDRDTTLCGITGAASWSRAVTVLQAAGLVEHCEDCAAQK